MNRGIPGGGCIKRMRERERESKGTTTRESEKTDRAFRGRHMTKAIKYNLNKTCGLLLAAMPWCFQNLKSTEFFCQHRKLSTTVLSVKKQTLQWALSSPVMWYNCMFSHDLISVYTR